MFTSTNLYYTNLNSGGQKGLTEVVFATAMVERSRLIVALTEVVSMTASVNHSTEAGSLKRPLRLIDKKTKKILEPTDKPVPEPAGEPVPSTRARSGPTVAHRAAFRREEPPPSVAQSRPRERERERVD